MFNTGNIFFEVQLILGELIILYSCPKRKHYLLNGAISISIAIILSYFFPMPEKLMYMSYYSILRFFVLFCYSMVAMVFCFKLNFGRMLSFCAIGYALQHATYNMFVLFTKIPFGIAFENALSTYNRLFESLFYLIVYLILFFTLGRHIAKRKYYKQYNFFLSIISILIVVVCIIISIIARNDNNMQGIAVSTSLYSIICCFLAIFIQLYVVNTIKIKQEAAAIKQMAKSEKTRYESVKSIFEAIGVNYHDLKHKVYSLDDKLILDEMRKIKDTLKVVDRIVFTGNEILDVIITEKSVQYSSKQVTFSFSGNSSYVDFLDENDFTSLFGNAISNAAEAASKVECPEKRKVLIAIEKSGTLVSVVIKNYFSNAPKVIDGDIVSTKEGIHGLGLKSIKHIANKYNGNIQTFFEDDIFTLSIYFIKDDQ